MRYILFFSFLLSNAAALADADSASFAFQRECKKIDAKVTGFSCDGFKKGTSGPRFTFREAPKNLPEKSREEFEWIVQRYFDLGGHFFYIARADRPKKEYAACYPTGRRGWGCRKFCGAEYLSSVKVCE